jgi:hypothetical protein
MTGPALHPICGGTNMASGDFCQPIPSPLDDSSTRLVNMPPQVRYNQPRSYARRIYVHALRAGRDFGDTWLLIKIGRLLKSDAEKMITP